MFRFYRVSLKHTLYITFGVIDIWNVFGIRDDIFGVCDGVLSIMYDSVFDPFRIT